MKKKLMGVVLAIVLCLGMFTTVGAAPSAELTQLPVPTNLRWGDNFDPQWDVVKEAHGHYIIEIYKDGALHQTRYWSLGDWEGKTFEEINYSPEINESGTYSFRVASNNSYDPEGTVRSEFSVMSAEKVYTRPATALGTTVGFWDPEKEGTFCFYGVENAGGYRLTFYKMQEDGTYRSDGSTWSVGDKNDDTATQLHKRDLTDRITESGKYAVTIQALSADISAIANGSVGEKSLVFDTSITSGKVEEELDEAYAKKHGIKVGNAVDPAVAALGVDSSKVSMVGAALNAGAGNVTLEMKVAEEKKDINTNRYKNSVQIDLKLNTANGYKSKLDVPVTITMPAPSGLDLGKLTILHFCQDGTEEVISPKTADNSMFLYVAMLAVAACGVMVCKTRKVK